MPYFSSSRLSSDPAFTPIRMPMPASLAARAMAPTWSSNLRMFPGLTRTAAQPASIAAKTYLGWKWMSAITGICECLRDLGQRLGVVGVGHGHPDDLAAGRGEFGDLLQRRVDVSRLRGAHRLHRDRVVAADPDAADVQLARLPTGRQHRDLAFGGQRGHTQTNGHRTACCLRHLASSAREPLKTNGPCKPETPGLASVSRTV